MKEQGGQIHLHEGSKRMLGYDSEFKNIIASNPGAIRDIKALTTLAENYYNPPNINTGNFEFQWDRAHQVWEEIRANGQKVTRLDPEIPRMSTLGRGTFFAHGESFLNQEESIEVRMLGKSNRALIDRGAIQYVGVPGQLESPTRIDVTSYFQVDIKGRKFFVKRSTATQNPGFDEYQNTINTREALKDFADVEVVGARLGYQDNSESWFVSDWTEIESAGFAPTIDQMFGGISDYGVETEAIKSSQMRSERRFLAERVKQINERLKDKGINLGVDLGYNIFYNSSSKKILLLDITDKYSRKLNQP